MTGNNEPLVPEDALARQSLFDEEDKKEEDTPTKRARVADSCRCGVGACCFCAPASLEQFDHMRAKEEVMEVLSDPPHPSHRSCAAYLFRVANHYFRMGQTHRGIAVYRGGMAHATNTSLTAKMESEVATFLQADKQLGREWKFPDEFCSEYHESN